MNPVQLAFRVLRADRRTRVSTLLIAVGVAVATGLVLLLMSLPQATKARAVRTVWTATYSSPAPATMMFAKSEDFTEGDPVTRVDLAAKTDPAAITLPPGLPRFPRPGEVLVSPALLERMHKLSPAQLADRFPGRVVGTLTDQALAFPGELVAVVGHTPDSMPSGAAALPGFRGSEHTDGDPSLNLLAWVGIVVLLVPSLALVGSSSRLIAARRERRLAALRLAGATPGQVTATVAAETGIAAVVGALLGLAVSPVLRWLATFVPWGGGTWLAGDFRLPLAETASIVAGMPVLVVLAAVLGLRRVMRNPIGAASAQTPKPLRAWRLLALPLTGAAFYFAVSGKKIEVPLVMLTLFLLLGSVLVVGPWLTYAAGRIFVRLWRRPSGLLAGRRLLDDPRGAYRASAGVVLAVLVGSMALTLMACFEGMSGGGGSFRDPVLLAYSENDQAAALVSRVDARLAGYGQRARAVALGEVSLTRGGSHYRALVVPCEQAGQLLRVEVGCLGTPAVYLPSGAGNLRIAGHEAPVPLAEGVRVGGFHALDSDVTINGIVDPAVLPAGVEPEQTIVAVSTEGSDPEVVRTVLGAGGDSVFGRDTYLAEQDGALGDLRRVTVIGLVVAGALAGGSAAISTAGSVLDRRRTFGALIAAGTPVPVLSRALRAEAALPALVATVGAGGMGVGVGLGLFHLIQIKRPGAVAAVTAWASTPVVLGIGVALLAASVCTPALNRVRAEPLSDE
ncbi:FtsX-like permease family protein [Amycolatopsis rhizosphaerae]|uniref:FtsX-like permease family protein n=1 Tax=Amycolatopsis rhizosphaerae TaxID=2053003 RepID=A0A558CW07_9PSEU|nr:FtsX-like permease family protein [Amycolatopsis rhizosphaerae]TVT52945.1 FtsX-like permease family protein [Amycolatopsis rhizosphaerae]